MLWRQNDTQVPTGRVPVREETRLVLARLAFSPTPTPTPHPHPPPPPPTPHPPPSIPATPRHPPSQTCPSARPLSFSEEQRLQRGAGGRSMLAHAANAAAHGSAGGGGGLGACCCSGVEATPSCGRHSSSLPRSPAHYRRRRCGRGRRRGPGEAREQWAATGPRRLGLGGWHAGPVCTLRLRAAVTPASCRHPRERAKVWRLSGKGTPRGSVVWRGGGR
jgi:hypothetical protein